MPHVAEVEAHPAAHEEWQYESDGCCNNRHHGGNNQAPLNSLTVRLSPLIRLLIQKIEQ